MPSITLDGRAVRRMAHFVPTTSTKGLPIDALDFIIIRTIAQDSRPALQVSEISSAAEELFQQSIDHDEIQERLKELMKRGTVQWDAHTGFFVLPAQRSQMQQEVRASEQLEQQVIENWLADLGSSVAGETLTAEDMEALRIDLLQYISLVYHVHGAECASFITRDARFAEDLLKAEQANTLNQLPQRDERMQKIRKIALPAFFQNGDARRKAYLSSLLNSSFVLMVLSGDRTMAGYWRENWRGATFYLDTNFVLRVLNVQGSDRYHAATRMLKLCYNAGVTVKVTNVTLQELSDVLRYWRINLESKRPPSSALAKLAWKTPRWEASIVTAYYEHIATGGESADFFSRFTLVERQLKAHGVIIDPVDYFATLQNHPKRAEYISKLMERTKRDQFDRAEHDALHRLLVEKQRGGKVRDPLEAKIWFLTNDGRLAEYEHRRAIRDGDVPTTMSTSTWMQLVRPILGRNYDDYDTTFMSMVTSPHLRAFDRITPSIASEVVSRIQKYDNIPPEVACMLMQNDYLCQKLANSSPQEEERLINLEIAEALKEAHRQAEEERIQREGLEKQLELTKHAVEQAETLIGEERKRYEESLAQKSSEREKAVGEAQAKIDVISGQREQLRRELQQKEEEAVRASDAWRKEQQRLEAELQAKEAALRAEEAKAREAAEALAALDRARTQQLWKARKIGAGIAVLMVNVGVHVIDWNEYPDWTRLGVLALLAIAHFWAAVLAFGWIPVIRMTWRQAWFKWVLVGSALLGYILLTVSRILGWENYWSHVSTAFTLLGVILTVVLAIRSPKDADEDEVKSKVA